MLRNELVQLYMELFGKGAISRKGGVVKEWLKVARNGRRVERKVVLLFCFFLMFHATSELIFMKLDNCLMPKDLLVHQGYRDTPRFCVLSLPKTMLNCYIPFQFYYMSHHNKTTTDQLSKKRFSFIELEKDLFLDTTTEPSIVL